MKLTLTKQEAKFAHQSHYAGDFEVMEIKRSGYFNFFPFSMFYGISSIGGWNGLMSTDGEKIIITKGSYLDLSKTSKVFVIPMTSVIESNLDNVIGKYIQLNKPENGLTRTRLNGLVKLFGVLLGSVFLVPLGILFWHEKYRGKNVYFIFAITENYQALDKFKKLIQK